MTHERSIYENIIQGIRDYSDSIYLDSYGDTRKYEQDSHIKEHLERLAISLEDDLL